MGETLTQTLVMTRPRAAAERFVAGLSPEVLAGVKVLYSPLVEIEPTGTAVDLAQFAGAIFTSANGVAHGPDGGGRPAYCVGQRTATQAGARSWNVVLVAQNAQDLIAQMARHPAKGPLVHLCGAHRRGDIAGHLADHGTRVQEQIIYRQPLQPLTAGAAKAIAGEVRVILPLFSPRTAAHLATQLGAANSAVVCAMSEAVADALGNENEFEYVWIAPTPTGDAMARGVEMWLRRDRLS